MFFHILDNVYAAQRITLVCTVHRAMPEWVMASRARAQISKRKCGPVYLVGEGCKEVCLMPFPLLWLPRKRDSAAEAGEPQDIGVGQSLSQHSPSPCL